MALISRIGLYLFLTKTESTMNEPWVTGTGWLLLIVQVVQLNTKLPASTVVSPYHGLWVVERAFCISKSTLETRPIFHFTERRIEAHVCLCFVAYKVYKELERIVTLLKLWMSVDTVLKIAKTITTMRVKLPLNNKVITRTMMLTPQHRSPQPLFDYLGIWF
jgi:transposase